MGFSITVMRLATAPTLAIKLFLAAVPSKPFKKLSSPPAQNALPLPVSTMQRTASSFSALVRASCRPSIKASFIEFKLLGRFMVMVAIPFSKAYNTASSMGNNSFTESLMLLLYHILGNSAEKLVNSLQRSQFSLLTQTKKLWVCTQS